MRFTSPHPAAFTDDVILAMAETPNVMPSLHMPLQSGSDRVLKEMRRSYRSAKFLGIIDTVREQIPDAAITTDIIVGFPGETDEDFEETLEVVRESRFSSAFTFQYSIRPGTPAATMDHQVPKAVVQERYDRLIAVQEEVSWAENRALEGREVEVLVATGEGRKDTETHRLSGPRPRQPPRALRGARGRPSVPGPATWSPSVSPTARRTTSSPTRPSSGGHVCRAAHRRAATPGPRSQDVPQGTGKPAVSLGMPCDRASLPSAAAAAGLLVGLSPIRAAGEASCLTWRMTCAPS